MLPSQVAIPVGLRELPDAHAVPVVQDELDCFMFKLVLLDLALLAGRLDPQQVLKLDLI